MPNCVWFAVDQTIDKMMDLLTTKLFLICYDIDPIFFALCINVIFFFPIFQVSPTNQPWICHYQFLCKTNYWNFYPISNGF